MINIFKYWHELRAWDHANKHIILFLFCVLTIIGITFVRAIIQVETRLEYNRESKAYTWNTGFLLLFKSAFFYIYFPLIGIIMLLKALAKTIKDFRLDKEPLSWW